MILIIYRSQVCREIVLPNADNTDYRIFIDSKEFKLKKSFYLSLEVIAHKWSITNENGEYKIVKNQSEFEKTFKQHKAALTSELSKLGKQKQVQLAEWDIEQKAE